MSQDEINPSAPLENGAKVFATVELSIGHCPLVYFVLRYTFPRVRACSRFSPKSAAVDYSMGEPTISEGERKMRDGAYCHQDCETNHCSVNSSVRREGKMRNLMSRLYPRFGIVRSIVRRGQSGSGTGDNTPQLKVKQIKGCYVVCV